MIEKFTNNVIDAAQRELTVETANKIQSLANNVLNIIKPETIKFLSKLNGLVDKSFTIPKTLPIDEDNLQNTPAMDDYENECKQNIAKMDRVYTQQALMISHLMAELDVYDGELSEEANIDMDMFDSFENNFINSNFDAEVVDNVVRQLNDIDFDSKSPSS